MELLNHPAPPSLVVVPRARASRAADRAPHVLAWSAPEDEAAEDAEGRPDRGPRRCRPTQPPTSNAAGASSPTPRGRDAAIKGGDARSCASREIRLFRSCKIARPGRISLARGAPSGGRRTATRRRDVR
jgi:hypothetical protein